MTAPAQIHLTLPDGSSREVPQGTTPLAVATAIGPRLAAAAVGAELDGETVDLRTPLTRLRQRLDEAARTPDPDAIAAAQAGKMVLCEKPLAMNVAEGREMVDAVEKAGVPNMIWYNYRRVPAVTLAKQLIDEGRLGDVCAGQACAVRRRGVPTWGVFLDKERQGGGPSSTSVGTPSISSVASPEFMAMKWWTISSPRPISMPRSFTT